MFNYITLFYYYSNKSDINNTDYNKNIYTDITIITLIII